jgi:hypothetical protein
MLGARALSEAENGGERRRTAENGGERRSVSFFTTEDTEEERRATEYCHCWG